jgi:type I restriction enzyme M protein
MLEAVITLAGGVFYSTGVSACILFLNKNKKAKHKGKICLIDGSEIYTPKRAQNEVSLDDVKTLFMLYTDYVDVIEQCKIVTLQDVEKMDYDLSVKKYIERKKQKILSPSTVRKNYFSALERVKFAEDSMRRYLTEGGYIHE